MQYPSGSDNTALQLFSSGTTGLPKGIELTHANLSLMNELYAENTGFDGERSVFFNALPVFHNAGINSAFMPLIEGGRNVLLPGFDPARIIAAIAEHRVSHTFLVPAMMLFMLQVPGVEHAYFSSLKLMAYGGSPAGTLTTLSPEDHDAGGPRAYLLRSAGKRIRGVDLRIVDLGTLQDAKEGEVGEIWVRALHNMKGYWRILKKSVC
ncbi:AMP-binding protein [Noviherbaspirillum malthae]|uniref:AMP-binding protein n=1 Tax=Noviherbaspirillum malthae TaxID=1260987 RepID=UPI00188EA4F2|nr:AMP-binding protein [Noviherbaspirillum malthae]